MKRPIKILCVDDEPNVLNALQRVFLDEEYVFLPALSGEEGLEILTREETVQVVISDYRMPGMNGVDFLKEVCGRWPQTIRVVLSGYADIASIVSAINEGKIYKFIPKPWNDEELKLSVSQAVDIYLLQQEHLELVKKLTDRNESHERLMGEKTKKLLAHDTALRTLQGLLDSLPGGLLVLDRDQKIVHCNHTCRELFGNGEGPWPGQTAASVLPAQVTAFISTIKAEGRHDPLQLPGLDLEVKVKVLPAREEHEGARWIVEFWERG